MKTSDKTRRPEQRRGKAKSRPGAAVKNRPAEGPAQAQPMPGQPYGQPMPGQPYGQPMPGQPYGQPMPGQPYGQPMPGQPYGQPMPGQPVQAQPVPPQARPTRERQPRRAAQPPQRAERTAQPPRPRRKRKTRQIVYTPSRPFNRRRFLLQMSVVLAVVLACFFTMSLFFQVQTITVSGVSGYDPADIRAASGIEEGDGLLTLNDAQVSSRIIAKLPYVASVRIGIKLPGTVNIAIEELGVVYAICDSTDSWWLMSSEGRLVESTDAATASAHTKVLGVKLINPVAGGQATVADVVVDATAPEGETVPITVTNSQRLNTAIDILQYLEKNGILGEMASVDVSDMGSIELMQGQRFRIVLGDSQDLEYKISLALAAAAKLKDYDRGTLDASFLDRPAPEVVYTPQID